MGQLLLTIKGILSDPGVFIRRTRRLYETDRENSVWVSTFINQEYYWFYERIKPGTTVLDIGANIGDTAIYFAYNPNTKKVYSYELMPHNFEKAKRFIANSPLKSKISIFNMAVTPDPGKKIKVASNAVATATSNISEVISAEGVNVNTISLPKMLEGKKRVALKCDIEGVEEHLFDNANLSNVYLIMLECHNSVHTHVMDVFRKKGFKAFVYHVYSTADKGGVTLVCAYRK